MRRERKFPVQRGRCEIPRTTIVDYGVGNLLSLKIGLEKAGFTSEISSCPSNLAGTDSIVLPGVGNFSTASDRLDSFRTKVFELAQKGTPLIGICLGMQLLFSESDEGRGRGLEIFKGRNVKLPGFVKIPHIGWNTLHITSETEILEGVEDGCYFYFVHSLYPVPSERDIVQGETEYGTVFPSLISRHNVFGTQFHPEKSGQIGSRILKNFLKIVKR